MSTLDVNIVLNDKENEDLNIIMEKREFVRRNTTEPTQKQLAKLEKNLGIPKEDIKIITYVF